jgi:transposase
MPQRRKFSVEEKRAMVEEYDEAPNRSKVLVLRKHQLSVSTMQRWISYRDAGVLETGLRKGWQTRVTPKAESAEIARLRAEVKRLEAALAKEQRNRHVAEAAADALGKASALLQVMLESADPMPSEPSSPAASPLSSPPA